MKKIKDIIIGETTKVLGKIMELKMLPSKTEKWEGFVCNFAITDGEETLKCVYFLSKKDKSFESKFSFLKSIKISDVFFFKGKVSLLENYNFLSIKKDGIGVNVPTKQLTINEMEKLDDSKTKRKEESELKRVEFQSISNLSTLNSLVKIDKLVEITNRFDYPSVVVTDRGTAHSFPIIENELSKYEGLKGIYGCEFNTTNKTSTPVINGIANDIDFNDNEYIFFDLETTGIYPYINEIIEIGAILVKNNEIVDTFNVLIKPTKPISDTIINLTNITNELLDEEGISEKEGLIKFLDFVNGNEVFVGHNVSFDYSFLDFRMKKHSVTNKIENTLVIDTLLMSELLNNDLIGKNIRSHRLDSLLKRYGEEIVNHHRASDDSVSTYKLFNHLLEGFTKGKNKIKGIKDYEITNIKVMELKVDNKLRNRFEKSILVYAKNQKGLKSLYELVTLNNTTYNQNRVLPLNEILKRKENLILVADGFLSDIVDDLLNGKIDKNEWLKYDYIGLHSIYQDYHLLGVELEDKIKVVNKIIDISNKLGKKCITLGDVHYLNKKDEKYFKVVEEETKRGANNNIHRGKKYNAHFKTVKEIENDFYFLEDEKRKEIISTNTLKLNDEFEEIIIVPKGLHIPHFRDSDIEIKRIVEERLIEIFGDVTRIPNKVKKRVDYELSKIIGKFGVIYYVMHLVINKCIEEGHNTESRGSVGSSYVAYLMNITDINPLDVHYHCNKCKNFEFVDGNYETGFDLEEKQCDCGEKFKVDGHKIPFEMFVGFDGTKTPDIDVNFSGKLYQSKAHDHVREIFGKENVYRAGTISTYSGESSKYAVWKYLKEQGKKEIIPFDEYDGNESSFYKRDDKGVIKLVPKIFPKLDELTIDELVVSGRKGNQTKSVVRTKLNLKTTDLIEYIEFINGMKSTTGQHPGGLMIIPQNKQAEDFFPISFSSEGKKGNTSLISHMSYHPYEDTLLKLDLLGHDNPTIFYYLQKETGIKIDEIPMSDFDIIKMFRDGETGGISEFNTIFATQATVELKPTKFSHLVRISGLLHGEGVFLGNARDLISEGKNIEEVIACREDMLEVLSEKMESNVANNIMEKVRKGRGVNEEEEKMMLEKGIEQWYIDSMKKIEYLYPKAHATSYVISAYKLMWWKKHYPLQFTKVMMDLELSNTKNDFLSILSHEEFVEEFKEIEQRIEDGTLGFVEKDSLGMFKIVNYFYNEGFKINKIDLNKSHTNEFTYCDEHGLLMPLKAIPSMSESVMKKIFELREEKMLDESDLKKITSGKLMESIKKYI